MTWFSLNLKAGVDEIIEDSWQLAWQVARSGDTLVDYSNAIFLKAGSGESGPTIYFTPSARELAGTFGAKACDKPLAKGMTLIAGDRRAWEIHFEGEPGRPVMEFVVGRDPSQFVESSRPELHFEATHPSMKFEPTQPTENH